MKIAVIFDSTVTGGGGFYQSLASCLYLSKLENKSGNFYFIANSNEVFERLKKENLNALLLKNYFLSQIFYQLSKSGFLNLFFKFFKIKNPFLYFINKNNFDLVIFLGPSLLINLVDKINFIVSIYDINFKLDNFFPEYLSNKLFLEKDEIVRKSVNQSFKIFVDTKRSKNELIEVYNCPENKLEIQSFIPYLPSLEKNIDTIDSAKIIQKLGLENKKFIFYPAQFWAHKNHRYIIDAVYLLKKKRNINLNVVFCGSEKGTLSFVKNLIDIKGLKENFFIFDFLSEQEIFALYKNTIALVMPTYVARSTLPLFESFFFKIPVFYSKGVLDENIEKFVETFNLQEPESLVEKLSGFLSGKISFKEKIKSANEFYNNNCTSANFEKNYTKIINEYKYFSSIWTIN